MKSLFDPNASDEQILLFLKETKYSGISLVEYIRVKISVLQTMAKNYEGTEAGKMYENVANRLLKICDDLGQKSGIEMV